MSRLVFNGVMHQIALLSNGQLVGRWPAYNNVDPHATLRHVDDGIYVVLDKRTPRKHLANANGPYGLHGIVRFHVAGHPGIGVHSGRAFARRMPGPQHPTMGCIRTNDEAMRVIVKTMKTSPLTTVQVMCNGADSAHSASIQNQRREQRGSHG